MLLETLFLGSLFILLLSYQFPISFPVLTRLHCFGFAWVIITLVKKVISD